MDNRTSHDEHFVNIEGVEWPLVPFYLGGKKAKCRVECWRESVGLLNGLDVEGPGVDGMTLGFWP